MGHQDDVVRRSPTGRIPAWAMDEAVRERRHRPQRGVRSAQPAPRAPAVVTDLALNPPGAAARARAHELTDGHRVRSVLARLLGVRRPEHSWEEGATGEVLVARELHRLGGPWRVLHSVPVGTRGADIDHVVIGPAGVYTLNSKHHRQARLRVDGDRLWVNGVWQPYVRNSRHEAARASRLLSRAVGFPVPVTGVVVPVGAAAVDVRRQPSDVRVVNRRKVRGWLSGLPRTWTDEQVRLVAAAAARPSTWQ